MVAGCFDGTLALWRLQNSDAERVFQIKVHQLAIFDVTWNQWNQNLFATRSRDEVRIRHLSLTLNELTPYILCRVRYRRLSFGIYVEMILTSSNHFILLQNLLAIWCGYRLPDLPFVHLKGLFLSITQRRKLQSNAFIT